MRKKKRRDKSNEDHVMVQRVGRDFRVCELRADFRLHANGGKNRNPSVYLVTFIDFSFAASCSYILVPEPIRFNGKFYEFLSETFEISEIQLVLVFPFLQLNNSVWD